MFNRDVVKTRFVRFSFTLVCLTSVIAYPFNAYAGPVGGEIVGGAGSIDQSGLNTTINQNTQNLAIDWQCFDVKTDERVEFIEPNSL